MPRTVIIGFGNLLLKDEGVGIHIIQYLQEISLEGSDELIIIDGATCPDMLLLLPQGIEKLILIDAVMGGGKPGDVYRFTPNDLTFGGEIYTSVHHLGLAEGLRALELLGANPKEIIIIGVEPKEINWGLEISQELKNIFPRVKEIIKKEIY